MRKCCKCGNEYDETKEFFPKLNKYWWICRECLADERREYKKRNPEKVKEEKRRYAKAHPEKIRQKKREQYRRKHPVKPKLPKTKPVYKLKPTTSELERQTCKKHRRAARKNGLAATYTYKQWCSTKATFGHKCAYCGEDAVLTQDHFIPLSKGGEYTHNNIVPVCSMCNSNKRDLDFFEWYPQQPFYSNVRERKILKYLNYDGEFQQLAMNL